MTDLSWCVSQKTLDDTAKILASKDSEVFVFWTTSIEIENNRCEIKRVVMPEQDTHNGLEGVYVHIEGKELSRIIFDNYKKNERNVIQIHTHPSYDVQMSSLDRQWEVVNHVGALSIIVPNYGKNYLNDFPGVNIYEREIDDWRLWGFDEHKTRIKIT